MRRRKHAPFEWVNPTDQDQALWAKSYLNKFGNEETLWVQICNAKYTQYISILYTPPLTDINLKKMQRAWEQKQRRKLITKGITINTDISEKAHKNLTSIQKKLKHKNLSDTLEEILRFDIYTLQSLLLQRRQESQTTSHHSFYKNTNALKEVNTLLFRELTFRIIEKILIEKNITPSTYEDLKTEEISIIENRCDAELLEINQKLIIPKLMRSFISYKTSIVLEEFFQKKPI